MVDYLEFYKFDEIISKMVAFVKKNNLFHEQLEEGTECVIAMNPDEMMGGFATLYSMGVEITDILNVLESDLGSILSYYLDTRRKITLYESIKEYIQEVECMKDLMYSLDKVHNEYKTSDLSENFAGMGKFCFWKCMYCERYPFVNAASEKLVMELCWARDEISDNKEQEIAMNCVYAPPEILFQELFSNQSTEEYPFTHAETSDAEFASEDIMEDVLENAFPNTPKSNMKFCIHCGELIAEQETSCPVCGRNVQIEADPDVTVQFCWSCSKDVPLIARFCPFCGKRLRK